MPSDLAACFDAKLKRLTKRVSREAIALNKRTKVSSSENN